MHLCTFLDVCADALIGIRPNGVMPVATPKEFVSSKHGVIIDQNQASSSITGPILAKIWIVQIVSLLQCSILSWKDI